MCSQLKTRKLYEVSHRCQQQLKKLNGITVAVFSLDKNILKVTKALICNKCYYYYGNIIYNNGLFRK